MRLRFCRHKCVIWCSIEWTTKGPAVKFKYVNAINWWIYYAFEVDFTCFSRYIILLRRSCGQSGCNLSRHLCHFTGPEHMQLQFTSNTSSWSGLQRNVIIDDRSSVIGKNTRIKLNMPTQTVYKCYWPYVAQCTTHGMILCWWFQLNENLFYCFMNSSVQTNKGNYNQNPLSVKFCWLLEITTMPHHASYCRARAESRELHTSGISQRNKSNVQII